MRRDAVRGRVLRWHVHAFARAVGETYELLERPKGRLQLGPMSKGYARVLLVAGALTSFGCDTSGTAQDAGVPGSPQGIPPLPDGALNIRMPPAPTDAALAEAAYYACEQNAGCLTDCCTAMCQFCCNGHTYTIACDLPDLTLPDGGPTTCSCATDGVPTGNVSCDGPGRGACSVSECGYPACP